MSRNICDRNFTMFVYYWGLLVSDMRCRREPKEISLTTVMILDEI